MTDFNVFAEKICQQMHMEFKYEIEIWIFFYLNRCSCYIATPAVILCFAAVF